MIKKLLLILVLFFSIFSISFLFADDKGKCPTGKDGENAFCSTDFVIETSDILPFGKTLEEEDENKVKKGGKAKAEVLVVVVTKKLMIGLGVIALLIMTVGGGYMIVYHGQDELLSKGKTIFISGVIALIIALSSSLLVKLVASILFS